MKIELNSLSKTYQDAHRTLPIIEELTFSFREGESTAILGKSGVGKSTLLHLIGGLDAPTSGAVTLGETNITALSDDELAAFRGAHIGFVFQFHHLLPEFSAEENVSMPLLIAGVESAEAKSRATDLLSRVGLGERMDHLPSQLSGGEQQRVAIARAVVSNPGLLLADEPTGNLDPQSAAGVEEVLRGLPAQEGCTLVIVTHSRELAGRLDNEIEMVAGGQLHLPSDAENRSWREG